MKEYDSKLLSGFSCKYESVTEKALWQRCTRRIDIWEEVCRHSSKWLLRFFETKSVIKTQRRYRTQYGKEPPSDNAIRHWLKQFQGTGNVLHRKGTSRSSTLEGEIV
jgi:hypothetical protein